MNRRKIFRRLECFYLDIQSTALPQAMTFARAFLTALTFSQVDSLFSVLAVIPMWSPIVKPFLRSALPFSRDVRDYWTQRAIEDQPFGMQPSRIMAFGLGLLAAFPIAMRMTATAQASQLERTMDHTPLFQLFSLVAMWMCTGFGGASSLQKID